MPSPFSMRNRFFLSARFLSSALGIVVMAGQIAYAQVPGQTPAIRPNTPDVVIPPATVLVGGPSVVLTADEAVAIALKRQPALLVAIANGVAAAGRAKQARAGLQPQLSLNGNTSQQAALRGQQLNAAGVGGGQEPLGTFTPRSTTSLNVSQLLFDFGRAKSAAGQQNALARAIESIADRVSLDTSLAVRQAFYDYRQAEESLKVAEANVANRQSQLALANARLDSGLGSPSDYIFAKTALADAAISLTNSRAQVEIARVNLAFQIGLTPTDRVEGKESEEKKPVGDLPGFLERATQLRPELREAQDRFKAAQQALTNAKSTNAPRLDFVGNVASRGGSDPLTNQTTTLGLNLSWTFGDGGQTVGRVREASAQRESAAQNLTAINQQVTREVANAYTALIAAEQALEIAKVQAANAKELVRITVGRYQGGVGNFLDVTTAQNSLFSAERNLVQTTLDVQRAIATLNRAIGIS